MIRQAINFAFSEGTSASFPALATHVTHYNYHRAELLLRGGRRMTQTQTGLLQRP